MRKFIISALCAMAVMPCVNAQQSVTVTTEPQRYVLIDLPGYPGQMLRLDTSTGEIYFLEWNSNPGKTKMKRFEGGPTDVSSHGNQGRFRVVTDSINLGMATFMLLDQKTGRIWQLKNAPSKTTLQEILPKEK